MILTGKEIKANINKGSIIIDPFNEKQINPNSYNLRLYNELVIYQNKILDVKKNNEYDKAYIPEDGIMLLPEKLYLGRTVEYTETNLYVPMLSGRSSIGRLGITIHITAGFGDIGFRGFWTLEISVVQPVIIYPFIEICQIYYCIPIGDISYYTGKYQNNNSIQISKIYEELND